MKTVWRLAIVLMEFKSQPWMRCLATVLPILMLLTCLSKCCGFSANKFDWSAHKINALKCRNTCADVNSDFLKPGVCVLNQGLFGEVSVVISSVKKGGYWPMLVQYVWFPFLPLCGTYSIKQWCPSRKLPWWHANVPNHHSQFHKKKGVYACLNTVFKHMSQRMPTSVASALHKLA